MTAICVQGTVCRHRISTFCGRENNLAEMKILTLSCLRAHTLSQPLRVSFLDTFGHTIVLASELKFTF